MTFVADRRLFEDAATLISVFGPTASLEAAMRAHRSRNLGNVVHFCRWRQVERLIVVLAAERADDTLH